MEIFYVMLYAKKKSGNYSRHWINDPAGDYRDPGI
jgi:hypothetical protein